MWTLRSEITQLVSAAQRPQCRWSEARTHAFNESIAWAVCVALREMSQNLETWQMEGCVSLQSPRVSFCRPAQGLLIIWGKVAVLDLLSSTHQRPRFCQVMLTCRTVPRKYANDFCSVEKIGPEVMVLLPIRTFTEQSCLMFFFPNVYILLIFLWTSCITLLAGFLIKEVKASLTGVFVFLKSILWQWEFQRSSGWYFYGDGVGAAGRGQISYMPLWMFIALAMGTEQLKCSRMSRSNQKSTYFRLFGQKNKKKFGRFFRRPWVCRVFQKAQQLPASLGLFMARAKGKGLFRSFAFSWALWANSLILCCFNMGPKIALFRPPEWSVFKIKLYFL